MQIRQINSTVPKKDIKQQGRNKKNINNETAAFRGIGAGLDKIALGTANLVENGGLFVSFTLQDMLGTNLPRPLMGLKRNSKENKGKANYSFAAKELVREMMTGPSMFIIPAIMLKIGTSIFGKATKIPARTIKALGDIHLKEVIKNGKAITKEEFYTNAFSEIIKNAKQERTITEQTKQKAKEFAEKLSQKGVKDSLSEISDDFVNIVKSHAKDSAHTDFTSAVLNENTSASIKETIKNIAGYADDVVAKAAKKSPENLNTYVQKLVNNKTIGRTAMNLLMFGTVLSFLQIIPKLYNKAEGKDNAGLKGLMKEETLNDKTLETNNQTKSTPSFGSAASLANKLTNNGFISNAAKGVEFSGCNLSFPLLLGVMGLGILTPRLRQAKDKYDREEILRRDLITCTAMCFFEKMLRKGFSKINETKSGFVLASKNIGFKSQSKFKRFFDYIRPEKGVRMLTSDQIVSKYSNIETYKNGILGFCDFITEQGGNLKKVFGLTDESKNIVENILGKSLDKATNDEIKQALTNKENSQKIKEQIKELTNLFKDKDNAWVTKAKTLNARFTALAILVLVPAFLGFLLPAINEHFTKKRVKQEQAEQKDLEISNNIQNNVTKKENNIFSEISNFE